MVEGELFGTILRLTLALVAGGLVGLERSYHGRPAGFREHTLVCISSCMLMLLADYHVIHVAATTHREVFLDPTRMAQGIMTGIGFLGAGVIIKEGLSVRGLTTSASIWITSAIGILAGIGFYFPLALSVALTLGVLSLFRWIEARMPTQAYYHFDVRFNRESGLAEESLRALIGSYGFSIANFSHRLDGEGRVRRHSMVLRSPDRSAASRLADRLEADTSVLEFRISPTGD